jgi:hypothetical protein
MMTSSAQNVTRWGFAAIAVSAMAHLGLGVSVAPAIAQTSEPQSPAGDETLEQLRTFNPPPQLSERPVGITQVPCELGAPLGLNEIEGETYYCGILTVPMRRDQPELGNLDLHFSVAKATGDNPEPDSLVFLAGGPGQSATTADLGAYRDIRSTRDIVRLDQRGTGQSQRLGLEECLVLAFTNATDSPQLAALAEVIAQSEAEGSGGDLSSSLASPKVEPLIKQLCAEQFVAQGLDLNGFTTAESAQDVIDLVNALGYETINLHGISYGSRLAIPSWLI